MIKLQPYFHIGSYELAKELHNSGYYSDWFVDDVHTMVCTFFGVKYSPDYTQLIYTSYDEIEAMPTDKHMGCEIVSILMRDNVNVLRYTEMFCIEF